MRVSETQSLLADEILAKAFHRVGECLFPFGTVQAACIVSRRAFVDTPHGLPLEALFACIVCFLCFVAFHTVAFGEALYCLREGKSLHFHEEADSVTSLGTSTEAMPRLPYRRHVERRCPFLMERTAANIVHAFLGEVGHVFLYQGNDVRPVKDGVNGFLANHGGW